MAGNGEGAGQSALVHLAALQVAHDILLERFAMQGYREMAAARYERRKAELATANNTENTVNHNSPAKPFPSPTDDLGDSFTEMLREEAEQAVFTPLRRLRKLKNATPAAPIVAIKIDCSPIPTTDAEVAELADAEDLDEHTWMVETTQAEIEEEMNAEYSFDEPSPTDGAKRSGLRPEDSEEEVAVDEYGYELGGSFVVNDDESLSFYGEDSFEAVSEERDSFYTASPSQLERRSDIDIDMSSIGRALEELERKTPAPVAMPDLTRPSPVTTPPTTSSRVDPDPVIDLCDSDDDEVDSQVEGGAPEADAVVTAASSSDDDDDDDDGDVIEVAVSPPARKRLPARSLIQTPSSSVQRSSKWNLCTSDSPMSTSYFATSIAPEGDGTVRGQVRATSKAYHKLGVSPSWGAVRETRVQYLYEKYNAIVWDKRLPPCPISWNRKVRTAGSCHFKRVGSRMVLTGIMLSRKYNKTEKDTLMVLLHEMCHAASYVLDGYSGHGAPWVKQCRIVEKKAPEVGPIGRRCHETYEYPYYCSNADCRTEYLSHKRSTRKNCRSCKAPVVLPPGFTEPKRYAKPLTAFALFVSENCARVKQENPTMPHKDIMKLLSVLYRQSK